MVDIVCISHLRWDWVWQRPQHILSRLAKENRILYVEEPVTRTGETRPYLERVPEQNTPYLTALRLVLPAEMDRWLGHGEGETPKVYEELLLDYLKQENFLNPVLWLYTPMALHFVDVLPHSLLVYDVMDELSAFAGAPSGLIEREKELLRRADVVFTGGASLYRAKLPYNEHTYLFPSGVETEHFARASEPEAFPPPPDIAGLSHPLLGYYGVIDERMDFKLLAAVAEARPDWTFLMIGPLAKISKTDLPEAANMHFTGQKNYEELPAYLHHFDVALVPFALSETTRFLSPTKTLEYIAAHKPVVSTPLNDVIELYGSVVRIAKTPQEFIEKVEEAMTEDPEARRAAEDKLLSKQTWDKIASSMNEIITAQLLDKANSSE
ncbi:MAG TPA: glycosyltransferase [Chloroflexia bacterium]|nr:glycosyltransferase [Chloroflexia bacterium]